MWLYRFLKIIELHALSGWIILHLSYTLTRELCFKFNSYFFDDNLLFPPRATSQKFWAERASLLLWNFLTMYPAAVSFYVFAVVTLIAESVNPCSRQFRKILYPSLSCSRYFLFLVSYYSLPVGLWLHLLVFSNMLTCSLCLFNSSYIVSISLPLCANF